MSLMLGRMSLLRSLLLLGASVNYLRPTLAAPQMMEAAAGAAPAAGGGGEATATGRLVELV